MSHTCPKCQSSMSDGFVLDNLDIYQERLSGTTTAERKQGVADIVRQLCDK